MDEKEKIELLLKLAEMERDNKPIVEKVSDVVVDVVEAPFKIAGRLFDDIFGT